MDDKASSEILDKVKKLLALGTSPSEAEAASALEKARTLLARYGLSLADVEAHAPEVSQSVLLEKKRLRPWETHLIHVIALCTFTQALHVNRGSVGQILLVGREINIGAAQNLFEYLHLVVLKLGRSHRDQVVHLESFKRGVVHRLGERLATPDTTVTPSSASPSAAEDRQLTLKMSQNTASENQNYIGQKFGKTSTKRVGRRVDGDSFHKGRTAGDGVSLHKQVK